ncbi:MAG: nucleotidyltransferase domain-containing protein [Parcubacteria group bacterium]|nr:nucleotidyltransferase domain-containing protein [Parcubacteria group bacterium]
MLLVHNPQADSKLSALKKYLPFLAAVPYTRLIFLSGSVATGTAKPESDIDLVVVAQKNRIWLNRILLETAVWLVGRRRSRTKFKNRFCFNMFLADDSPLLPHQDAVAADCYKNLKPVWAVDDEQLKNFWRVNNWIRQHSLIEIHNLQTIFPETSRWIKTARTAFEKILGWSGAGFVLEKLFFKLQYLYLEREFDAGGGFKNPQADFFVTPRLIAYHFPVSHHSREAQRHKDLSLKINPS